MDRTEVVGKIADTIWRALRLDHDTHALKVLDIAHGLIHEGKAFTAFFSRTTANTDAHRTGIYIKTPATKEVHLVASFAASAAANLSIHRAPTIAANVGTHTSVIRNRDENSSTASECKNNATTPAAALITTLTETQIAADLTWADGTVIREEPLTAGVGPKPAGGSTRDTQEYILKANTAYVFLLTNVGANANIHHILLDWYEVEEIG